MERINSVDGLFHDGNPATGVKGTIVTAAWLNAVQDAVIAVEGVNKTIAADYTLLETDGTIFVDTSAGVVNITLPVYDSVPSTKSYRIKVILGDNPAYVVTVDDTTVDNSASIELPAPGDRAVIIKDGTNWQTF